MTEAAAPADGAVASTAAVAAAADDDDVDADAAVGSDVDAGTAKVACRR